MIALFSCEKTVCPLPEALQRSPDSSCEPQSQPAPYVPWSLPTLASYPPHQPPCPVAFSLLLQLTGKGVPTPGSLHLLFLLPGTGYLCSSHLYSRVRPSKVFPGHLLKYLPHPSLPSLLPDVSYWPLCHVTYYIPMCPLAFLSVSFQQKMSSTNSSLVGRWA